MKYFSEGKLVIKSWCNNPEEGAIKQAYNMSNLPFAFKHICLMPDTHEGYGMPIGGVLATKGVIIPNAVGVDIGCGMVAVRTSLRKISTNNLLSIISDIRKEIPVGFNHHKEKQDEFFMPPIEQYETDCFMDEFPIVYEQYDSVLHQLGTLGGGNHFIEIQKGNDGYIWIMIHSGSRNLGYKVAKYYNEVAKKLNKRWYSNVDSKWDLAFLSVDSEEGQSYIREMNYCVDFAFANRKLMMDRIKKIFKKYNENIEFSKMINIAHNYARLENHFGVNVWIHRKGATSARKGEIGIIPGSQGTSSYIVEGLGNPDSFASCSHGAGRRMSRIKAREVLNLEEEQNKLQGIVHSVREKKDLDEASSAYKDIDVVMEEQKDLVRKTVELKPLGVIKG